MMTKKELLSSLRKSLETEETAIPVYTTHLSNTLFLSSIDKEEKHTVESVLRRLKIESETHEKIFQDLINKVEKSDQDVY